MQGQGRQRGRRSAVPKLQWSWYQGHFASNGSHDPANPITLRRLQWNWRDHQRQGPLYELQGKESPSREEIPRGTHRQRHERWTDHPIQRRERPITDSRTGRRSYRHRRETAR